MKELKCPHCGQVFRVDENDYMAIAAQVRSAEFDSELKRHICQLELQHKAEAKAKVLEAEKISDKKISDKNLEINELRQELERLNGIISGYESEKQREIEHVKGQGELAVNRAILEKERELAEARTKNNREIAELRSRLESAEARRKLDLAEEKNRGVELLAEKDRKLTELQSRMDSQEAAAKIREMELRENHAVMMKAKEEEIMRYRDMKLRLSTKMLGETLEIHCQNMFNHARSQGMFPFAYFEKDNDARAGSKGDFIFRDFIGDEEYISIMFEMKNEDDRTATKHRNEDFFSKLDRDRNEKHCEYAVLVSMLEADNELYNEGIVDVSYRYPKMLVIRPQFFMSVIVMLSQASRRNAEKILSLRRELEIAKAQSVDVTNFERRRDQFVAEFGKLVDSHLKKQDDALSCIDKAIEQAEKQIDTLRKAKTLFEDSRKKLLKANESAENNFTIKKLIHGNPTMRAKFEEARKLAASEGLPE